MTAFLRWCDTHRMMPLLLLACATMLLATGLGVLWSRGVLTGDGTSFASLSLLKSAYEKVEPGRTSQSDLVALGFDSTRLKARALSGLGVQEYFMPRTSADYDRLDPAIRACFEAPDRCNALLFPLAAPASGGFMAANAAPRGQGGFVFLLKSGRVAYKAVQPS
jgi:hypothetical protein